MPKNRRTRIRIRTHEVTIIRLREINSSGDPCKSSDESGSQGSALLSDELPPRLLSEGEAPGSSGRMNEPAEDEKPSAETRPGTPKESQASSQVPAVVVRPFKNF